MRIAPLALLALVLAGAVTVSGCFFSLDGSLVGRPRESSVRDGRIDAVDQGPGFDGVGAEARPMPEARAPDQRAPEAAAADR